MHAHRSAAPPAGVARPGSPAFEHQRRLLLELAVDPPRDGDAIADLAAALELTPAQVEQAATGLRRAGLARRRGVRLLASPAALAAEVLRAVGAAVGRTGTP